MRKPVSTSVILCLVALLQLLAGCASEQPRMERIEVPVKSSPAAPPLAAPSGPTYPMMAPPTTVEVERVVPAIASVPDKDRLYPVMYATNRRFVGKVAGTRPDFSGERSDTLTFGRCLVLIPRRHQIGSLGSGPGTLFGYDPKLKLILNTPYADEGEFFQNLRERLNIDNPNEAVVVFIHGYNNSFEEAVLRAGQIGADLAIPEDRMFLFSWPSRGGTVFSPLLYTVDEAAIDASEQYLAEFLSKLAITLGPSVRINLIAHSMGNRALLRVIHAAAERSSRNQVIKFGRIILAAPDVDRDVFLQLSAAYSRLSAGTTLYVSPQDKAVALSKHVHDYPRVGYVRTNETPREYRNIDTVLVEQFDAAELGHAYFASAERVLRDIASLLASDRPDLKQRVRIGGESGLWKIIVP